MKNTHAMFKKCTPSFLLSFSQLRHPLTIKNYFCKSNTITVFSFYVLSAQSSTQMIYNILTVIFSLPILIGDLSPLLYFSFYMLRTNIGKPKKSLPEKPHIYGGKT